MTQSLMPFLRKTCKTYVKLVTDQPLEPSLYFNLQRNLASVVINEQNILREPTKSAALGESDDTAQVVAAEFECM